MQQLSNAPKEIERKYTVKYLPDDVKIEKIQEIEQAFIYHDLNTLIRIRKVKTKTSDGIEDLNYIYTVKTKGDIEFNNSYQLATKYEIESKIEKEFYDELINKKISNRITKTRIVIPIQNKLKIEMDIYYEYLEGLLTAEVEFSNEEQAKSFIKPDWLGEEIGYKELSNRKLAEMDKKEFLSKVSEEFIKNNKLIIENLQKKLAINF